MLFSHFSLNILIVKQKQVSFSFNKETRNTAGLPLEMPYMAFFPFVFIDYMIQKAKGTVIGASKQHCLKDDAVISCVFVAASQ